MKASLEKLSKSSSILGAGYLVYAILPVAGEIYFEYTYDGFLLGNKTASEVLFSFVVFNILFVLSLVVLASTLFFFLMYTERILGIFRWRISKTVLSILRLFFLVITVATSIAIIVLLPRNIEVLGRTLLEGFGDTEDNSGLMLLDFLIGLDTLSFGAISFIISVIMLEFHNQIGFFKVSKVAYQLYFVASIVYIIELIKPVFLSVLLYPLSCLLIRRRLRRLASVLGRGK